jgi:hypothetical protein
VAGGWLVASGALSLAWPERVGPRWLGLIGAVVIADLGLAHLGLVPSTSADLYQGETQLARDLGRDHRVFLSPAAERALKFDRTHRFESFQPALDPWWIRESGLPNVLLLDRVPSANNFDPLVPGRFADWIAWLEALPEARREVLLPLMDVAWASWEVADAPPWIDYAAVGGASRARVVPRASGARTPEEALEIVADSSFDPSTRVVLEGAGAEIQRSGGQGTALVLPGEDPRRVELTVDAPDGGWVVLSDAWYPGWEVEVNGASARAYPADGVFRAVWVPAGGGAVVWTYRPSVARIGAAVTVTSLLVGAVGWWIVRRRSA